MDQFDVIANQPIVIDNVRWVFSTDIHLTREILAIFSALYRVFINKHGWLTLRSQDLFP